MATGARWPPVSPPVTATFHAEMAAGTPHAWKAKRPARRSRAGRMTSFDGHDGSPNRDRSSRRRRRGYGPVGIFLTRRAISIGA